MAWGPSAWLIATRIVQFFGAVTGTGLNGFLTAFIYSKDLDIPLGMVMVQLLIGGILIYTVIAMALQYTGKRTDKKGWLLTFIITDVLFLSADLAILCILSRSGLPQHCRGLLTFRPGTDQPHEGFTTLGFSDRSYDQRGELDHFCSYESTNFGLSVCLVFTFLASVVFASLAYYKASHVCDPKLHDLPSDDERSIHTLSPRPSSPSPPCHRDPAPNNHRISLATNVPPASEGILTRNTSIRSTFTTTTTSSGGRTSLWLARHGHGHTIPRRPIGQSPPPPVPPPARSPGGGGGVAFHPISLNEADSDDDDDDIGMQVADGMNYRLANVADGTQRRRTPPPPPPPMGNRTGAGQRVQQQAQQAHLEQQNPQPQRPPPPPPPQHPPSPPPTKSEPAPHLLSPQEIAGDDAYQALVSDGPPPAAPGLPPYEPPLSAHASNSTSPSSLPFTPIASTSAPPPQSGLGRSTSHSRSRSKESIWSIGGAGGSGMPRLPEEEEVEGDDAHLALVSDGMRPEGPGRYEGGQARGEK